MGMSEQGSQFDNEKAQRLRAAELQMQIATAPLSPLE
jgi:hypothetical protein